MPNNDRGIVEHETQPKKDFADYVRDVPNGATVTAEMSNDASSVRIRHANSDYVFSSSHLHDSISKNLIRKEHDIQKNSEGETVQVTQMIRRGEKIIPRDSYKGPTHAQESITWECKEDFLHRANYVYAKLLEYSLPDYTPSPKPRAGLLQSLQDSRLVRSFDELFDAHPKMKKAFGEKSKAEQDTIKERMLDDLEQRVDGERKKNVEKNPFFFRSKAAGAVASAAFLASDWITNSIASPLVLLKRVAGAALPGWTESLYPEEMRKKTTNKILLETSQKIYDDLIRSSPPHPPVNIQRPENLSNAQESHPGLRARNVSGKDEQHKSPSR